MAVSHIILVAVLSFVLGAKCQWQTSSTAPTTQLACTSPPVILNANFAPTSQEAGAIVTYTCLPGYQPTGSTQRICRNGMWLSSGPALSCNVIFCRVPPSIPSGSFRRTSNSYPIGAVVTYNCYTGYTINGTNTDVTCQPNRTWTATLPTCNKKDCGPPPVVLGANMSFAMTDYRSSTVYVCYEGYSMYNNGYVTRNNRVTATCLSTGVWGSSAECRPKDCGLPRTIANGVRLSRGNHLYGQEVAYECNHGFMPRLNSTIKCLATGRWSELPECIKVVCESPPTVANATSSSIGKAHFGNTTIYTCSRGFEIHGPTQVTCQADGTWTQTPTCTAVDCRTPPAIHFGEHTWNTTTYNSVAEYKCDEGYKLIGVAKIYCQQDGRWKDAPSCEMPPVPPGGAPSKSPQVSEPQTQTQTQNSLALTGLAITCAVFGVTTLLCVIILLYKVFFTGRKDKPFSYASYRNGDDSVNGI